MPPPESLRHVRFRRVRRRQSLVPPRVKTLLVLALFLAAARAALPQLALRHAQRVLGSVPGSRCSIEGADVALWRGAYRLRGVRLEQDPGVRFAPLVYIQEAEFSLDGRALLRGAAKARLVLRHPVINMVRGPTQASSQTSLDPAWRAALVRLYPAPLDTVQAVEGQLTYRNHEQLPPADFAVRQMTLAASGLAGHAARAHLSASAFRSATLSLEVQGDPAAEPPAFELRAELEGAEASELTLLLSALGGFEAETGRVRLALEVSASGGRMTGAIRPVFDGLRLRAFRGRRPGALASFRKALEAEAGAPIEPPRGGRLAAVLPLDLPAPPGGPLPAVALALRQALVRSLLPGTYLLRPL